jgi:hypothetical protein
MGKKLTEKKKLKYLEKYLVRFSVLACLNQPTRTEPIRFGLEMKKKKSSRRPPPPSH